MYDKKNKFSILKLKNCITLLVYNMQEIRKEKAIYASTEILNRLFFEPLGKGKSKRENIYIKK